MKNEIEINGKMIPFYFGTKALDDVCEDANLSLEQFYEMASKGTRIGVVAKVLYYGLKSAAENNSTDFKYKLNDAFLLIDQDFSLVKRVNEVVNNQMQSIFNSETSEGNGNGLPRKKVAASR